MQVDGVQRTRSRNLKNIIKQDTVFKDGFDKYSYYERSVQAPEAEVEFLLKTYKKLRKKDPTSLGEDFCGTYSICCEWVKGKPKHKAIGVDLDPKPMKYGTENHFSRLTSEAQKRISILQENVLDPKLPKVDILAALNFSYFIFKEREALKAYFKNCHRRMKKDGLFVMDCFGGSQCQEPNEEETEHDGFSYFWDQDSYDPVTNFAQYYIHFKVKGVKKRYDRAFSYDWRMWSPPEIKDILTEVGFKKSRVYWEGTTKDGEGDGKFVPVESGEDCEAWVTYIVAEA